MGLLNELNSKVGVFIDYLPINTTGKDSTGEDLGNPSTWSRQSIAVQALILVGTVISLTIVRRRYFSPISSVPGPFLASFSRLWHLRQIWRGDQQIAVAKQHEKYGPFVRIAHDEVSVCHKNATKSLFLAPLEKAEWYNIFVFPDWRTPGPISIRDPKEKLHSAKYLSQGFAHHNVIRSEPEINEILRKLFSWFDDAADTHKPMELGAFFSFAAYDITGEVTFSKTFGFVDKGEDIAGAIALNEGMELYFTVFGYFRWLSYLLCNPFTTWTELLPLGHLGGITKLALKERKQNPDARFDIAAHWFRALDKAGENNLHWNDGRLFAAAITNLGAGSDTVSCGLQSFVYHLLRHPSGWQRIRDEIDAARKIGMCRDSIITYEDAQKLPYLQASIKEALRIFAPVPMGLPRMAPKGGIKFDDTFFPEGTQLSINPHVLQTSKDLWGPDAAEFNPDRWLGSDAATLEKYFCPWGLGWASCPGQHVARIQFSKVAATMVRDYDFKQVDPKKEWDWLAYFTCVPKDWPVYVSKRTGA
ncbi:cytochrome P450 [Xylariales sp. AK1849]|nr:cytochrome P450 [Xylariales sp. AK1849]